MPVKQHSNQPSPEVALLMDQAKPAMAAFVKEARKVLGMSQEELADYLGMTQGSISGWEVGRMTPDFATLAALSCLSGVPLPVASTPAAPMPKSLFGVGPISYVGQLVGQANQTLPAPLLRSLRPPAGGAREVAEFLIALEDLVQTYRAGKESASSGS